MSLPPLMSGNCSHLVALFPICSVRLSFVHQWSFVGYTLRSSTGKSSSSSHSVEKQEFCSQQKYSVKTNFSLILCTIMLLYKFISRNFLSRKIMRVNSHKFHTVSIEHFSRNSNTVLDHICLTLKSATPDDE